MVDFVYIMFCLIKKFYNVIYHGSYICKIIFDKDINKNDFKKENRLSYF